MTPAEREAELKHHRRASPSYDGYRHTVLNASDFSNACKSVYIEGGREDLPPEWKENYAPLAGIITEEEFIRINYDVP